MAKFQIPKSKLEYAPPLPLRLKLPTNDGGSCLSLAFPSLARFDLVCYSSGGLLSDSLNYLLNHLCDWLARNGYQRIHRKKYKLAIDTLLANLWVAHKSNKQLVTPTKNETAVVHNPEALGQNVIIATLEFFAAHDLIKLNRGKPSSFDYLATWCEPTLTLISWFERDQIRAKISDRAAFIELRKSESVIVTRQRLVHLNNGAYSSEYFDEKIKINKRITIPIKLRRRAETLAIPVRAFNDLWIHHTPTLDGHFISPWCHRVFNETLKMGGRFYAPCQSLTKKERERILIDGVATVEPDYSGLHLHLLYADEGIQYDEDPYDVPGFDRGVVKLVMLRLLNTENLGSLAGAITKSGTPRYLSWYTANKARMEERRFKCARDLDVEVNQQKWLKGFIEGIPSGTIGIELINALKHKHRRIAHRFGEKNLGIKLQYTDGLIMGSILQELTKSGIPVLPVHDSIRCKIIDSLCVIDAMHRAYESATGFSIKISN